jgi:hypothetical protein
MEESNTRTKRRSISKRDESDGSSKRSKAGWSAKQYGGYIWKDISASYSASPTNGLEADYKFTMKNVPNAKVDGVTQYKGYSELFECSVYRNADNTYYLVDGKPLYDKGKALNELATKLATLSVDEFKAATEAQEKIGPIRNGLPTEDVLASLRDDAMDVDTAAGTVPSSHPSTILPSPDRQQVTGDNTGVVSPPSDDMTARSTTTSSSPGELSFDALATAFHRAKEIEILYKGLKEEVSTKTTKIESKDNEIEAKDAVIGSLKDEVAEVTTKKDAMIESKNAEIVSLTRSKTDLEREVSQLKRQIAPQQTSSDIETDPLARLDEV